MPKFLNDVDLNGNELLQALLEKLSADPTSVPARVYYHEGQNIVKFYNGTQWVTIGRLDQITSPLASVSLGGQRVTDLANPESDQDATSKHYVDVLLAFEQIARDGAIAQAIENMPPLASQDDTLLTVQTIDGVTYIIDVDLARASDLNTVASALNSHLSDGDDAHDASAISIADADDNFAGATTEDALAELVKQVSSMVGVTQDANLDSFWRAVQKRESTGEPVDILIISDSTARSTNTLLNPIAGNWPELLATTLAERFGCGYGVYYQAESGGDDWPVAVSGTTDDITTGLGLMANIIDTDSDTITVTTGPGCDRVMIAYKQQAGGGTLSVSIDGGAAQTRSTAGATDHLIWDLGAISAGSHTVVISRVAASGNVTVEGVMIEKGCRNPGGFRIWHGDHSGMGTVEFGADVGWAQSIGATKVVLPDLTIIALGINDLGDGAAAFRSGLDTMCTQLRTQAPGKSIMLQTQWGNGNTTSDTMAALAAEVRDKVADDGDLAIADMHKWTKHFRAYKGQYTWDGVHPTSAGGNLIFRSMMVGLGFADYRPRVLILDYPGDGVEYPFYYPDDTVEMLIEMWGAGGGGGAGGCGAAGGIRTGGGGGGSGSYSRTTLTGIGWDTVLTPPNDGTWKISAGAGGTGPAGRNTAGAGTAGGSGGYTWISSSSGVLAGVIIAQPGGGGGGGQNSGTSGTAGAAATGQVPGAPGAASDAAGTGGVLPALTSGAVTAGGAGGAGITAANATSAGGAGGIPANGNAFLAAGPGVDAGDILDTAGYGGGPGASNATPTRDGGDGGYPGGGGGGGAASVTGTTSGAGGVGGAGRIRVTCWLK